jgi:hypothetical protein
MPYRPALRSHQEEQRRKLREVYNQITLGR